MAIPETKNIPSLLSDDQYTSAVALIINSFDREVTRYPDDATSSYLMQAFISLYYNVDLFSFFTVKSLTEISEQFFTDDKLRKFLLNYVDRVSSTMSTSDLTYDDAFTDTIVEMVTRNKPHDENSKSLINKEVLSSLYINKEVLKSLLKDNYWLAVLYLLVINFHQSTVYKTVTGK